MILPCRIMEQCGEYVPVHRLLEKGEITHLTLPVLTLFAFHTVFLIELINTSASLCRLLLTRVE